MAQRDHVYVIGKRLLYNYSNNMKNLYFNNDFWISRSSVFSRTYYWEVELHYIQIVYSHQ